MRKLFLIICTGLILSQAKAEEIAVFTVSAGHSDRFDTPVGIGLDPITFEADTNLVLYERVKKDKVPVTFQIEQQSCGRVLSWILSSVTKAGEKRKYVLEKGVRTYVDVITVKDGGDELLIRSGADKVMAYHYGVALPPQGVPYEFRRSGFIHPLWSPTGEVLTHIQPKDHYHHFGIWNPWTKVTFEGETIDFWNLGEGKGAVRYKSLIAVTSGVLSGGFKVSQEHVVFKPGYEKIAMNELINVKLWNVNDESGKKVWLWDFTSTLNGASESPVVINEYRYAGFSIRATPEWNVNTSSILTSEGKTRKDGDGTTGRWMFCNGKAGGNLSGILFLSYPANFNHPEPMRIWPESSHDVFMNFSPTKNKDWVIEAGKEYALRYRVVVYSGEMTAARAEQYWQDFANPPGIAVEIKQ
jgi:hypothetical protein